MKKMRKKRHLLPLLGILLASCTTSFGQDIPLDPGVRKGKLSNGFSYFIRHNKEPQHRVIFYLANKIGSLQEDEDQRGLAHFMEHMSFNGTKNYPKNQLIEYLQKAGVRFGADLNAYTGFTETVYQLPIPSDDTAILRNGLQIMRDWAGEALLQTEEIDKERGVVIEEKRLRIGVGQRLQDKYFPLQVNQTRYARRLPIGTDEVLNGFTPDAVRRFYSDWYRPNLQALIVVGDINVDSMEAQIKTMFSSLNNPVKERPLVKYDIPLTGKNQFLASTDAEQTSTQLSIQIKQRELILKTKADFRSQIIRTLFNQALGGRLGELSMQKEPPIIQAQAAIGGFMGGLDAFSVSIVPKPGKMKEAFHQVWTEIMRIKQSGVTKTELQRGKLDYTNHMENVVKEKSKIPSDSYVQDYLSYFLQGSAVPGIDREYAIVKELIESISLDEVNALARAVIKDVDRDIFIFAPEKEKADLPTEAEISAWMKSIQQQKLEVWKDQTSDKKLMSILPVSGKVLGRERIDSIGVNIYILNNGVKVYVKPTNFKNEEILFSAFSEGGISVYPDSLFVQASAAGALIPGNGLDAFGPVELGKMLTGKSLQVQPYILDLYEGVRGGSVPKDLETALQLVNLHFTKPRYDTTLFNNNIKVQKAIMATRSNSSGTLFADTVNWLLSGYHYRSRPPSPERLDSATAEKAYAIYQERFANAADFVFVFTGSIDTTTFIPLIERYLGSLPSTDEKEKFKDLGMYVPKGRISKTVYKGKDDKAVVKLCYSGDYIFNQVNNTQLFALSTILQYRMTERIREIEGGAYTPRAGVDLMKLPRSRYMISIDFTCGPANTEKLIAAANDEISKIKSGGVSEDDINKFKAEQIRLKEMQLQQNGYWLGWLTYVLQNNEPHKSIIPAAEKLKIVTPESVKKTAREFINDENYIRLVLMPEP